jgi:hypothetical protein
MDTKIAGTIGTIIKVAIAVIGVIFCVLIMSNSEGIEMGENVNYVTGGLTISYIAFILCAGIALLFGLVYFITNIKKSKGLMFGLIGFAVIAGISYSIADGSLDPSWGSEVTETVSKLSSMGIYATVILLGVAVVMALASEVSKLLK